MPEKDPANYDALTYAWVFGLSAWGGMVSFLRRRWQKIPVGRKITLILTELTVCTFSGMVTFFLCEWSNLDRMLSAAMIAISGHTGTHAIQLTERFFEMRLRQALGVPDDMDPEGRE